MGTTKISRRGFLTLIFGGIASVLGARPASCKVSARESEGAGYGNGVYGGVRKVVS